MSDSEDSTVTYTAASSLFGGLSDIGSPGVEPQSPPPPDFVPEPIYPEFMPIEDEILPAKVQPLPVAVSPTADSPGYVLESDPEEDPEEDYDEDLEEDPADYPDDGGDDGDDEDEPSDDDEDEEVDIEADDEEEEEHPAPADSTAVAAMIRLRAEAASTSHSLPLPSLSPIPTPTSSPPLLLPSTNHREDRLEVTLPPRKRLGIALGPRYEVGESSSAAFARPARGLRVDYGFVATMDRDIRRDLERYVGYGITDSWDEIVEAMQGTPVVTDVVEFSQRMTKFKTRVRQDTYEIYTRLDDEQSERQLMAGRLNMLYRDRRTHARTARLMEAEARITAGSDYRAIGSRPQEAGGDYKDASGRSQEAEAVHRGAKADEEASDSDDRVRETARTRQGPAQPDAPEEAAPKKRTTRLNPETTPAAAAATTTTVTNAQLQVMIDQGVTAVLAAHDANTNDVDNHNSGTGFVKNSEVLGQNAMKNYFGSKRNEELSKRNDNSQNAMKSLESKRNGDS
ncbi:hypothetical protein Tco_1042814 [Tanacetum coccineum]|uniref:Uncharacterized protein n=1 Tax=Tanacetum coccineum TaxID=301880 RepID=A0ABQ5GKV0_9ASTR